MPAYVVITSDVHDPERLGKEYGPVANSTLTKHGGRVLAAGNRTENPEGGMLRSRGLILELPDLDTALRWSQDPEYTAVAKVREETSTTSAIAVAGMDAPAPRVSASEPSSPAGGAFAVVTLELTDPQRFTEEYIPATMALIIKHGGRMLAGVGDAEVLYGKDFRERTVIVEFDDMDTALGWYNSPEYAPLIKLRQETTNGDLVIISGD
ncbi:MAG TPA: DUF1330 domain-containing protein [Sporichthyaceae bacterium]|jgi:uncharacterized protein (DUF1330 family)